MDDESRFTICEATPKAGKTMSHIEWLLDEAISLGRGNHWWVATTYSTADIAFRRSKLRLKGYIDAGGVLKRVGDPIDFRKNESKRFIEVGGAVVWFKSAEKPGNLYGEDVYTLVGDEITRWKKDAWTACYSVLVATGGRAKLIGNVRGRRNFAYKLARRAESGAKNWGHHKLTAYDAIEGGVIDHEIIEQARLDMEPKEFKQLYEADAMDDGTNPFGFEFISKAFMSEPSGYPTVAFGVDLGKSVDWTWIVGLDAAGQQTTSVRFQMSWPDTKAEIKRIVGRDIPCIVDGTGVGSAIADDLSEYSGNFEKVVFTTPAKQALYGDLKSSLQGGRFKFFDPILKQELEDFEFTYTDKGTVYAAPEGLHDDGPDASALAVRCLMTYPPIQSALMSLR